MADERRRSRGQGGPVSDIERFLMEVERLRRKSAEERKRADDEPVDDVEIVRPAPRPVRPAPPPPPVRRPRPRPVEVLEPEPVLEVEPVRVAPEAPSAGFVAPLTPSVSAAPQVTATRTGQPVSAAIQQVAAMLRAKHQVRSAILISEILSPPLSKRRRRV